MGNRIRHLWAFWGSLLIISIFFLTDPDLGLLNFFSFGSSTVVGLMKFMVAMLGITLIHYARKALFDYIDMSQVYQKAMQTSEGAGKFAMAMGMFAISFALVIAAALKS